MTDGTILVSHEKSYENGKLYFLKSGNTDKLEFYIPSTSSLFDVLDVDSDTKFLLTNDAKWYTGVINL